MADAGKVAINDLGSSLFVHSYAAGLTLRAGGFPMVCGNKGTHTIGSMHTSLLGGSPRLSLY
jgi:hypothetical protein